MALTVVFTALLLGGALTGADHEGPASVTVPVALLTGAGLLTRTRAPLLGALVVTAAGIGQALASESPGTLMAFGVDLLLVFATASQLSEGLALLGGGLMVGGLWVQEWLDSGSDYLFILLVFGSAWLAGRGLHEWRTRATEAEEHQRDLARLAVSEERVRIARELHDVVANALSVVAVQADAAEAALARDPGLAADPLRRIRSSARSALTEMRVLLGALRPDDDERAPTRGLTDLPDLVDSMRAAGLPLEATLPDGTEAGTAAAGQAAYRIVQEALTNVLKHAGPVPTTLSVCREGPELSIRVENAAGSGHPSRPVRSGFGLVGARERVHALGGHFAAGPRPEGGFLLEARLPGGEVG